MIGKELGRYLIVEALGEGGMAAVYKAYDRRLNREVAVKVILRGYEHREMFMRRFEREAKSVAKLTHPNIVRVIDYSAEDEIPYLVMEFIPGGTLKEKMGSPIPWQKAAKMLAPVARALDYAHKESIIHRDIKPANILVTKSGDLMLSDFGIAKSLDVDNQSQLTGTGVGIGTPAYMAPEQGLGKNVDHRADVYSLGVVFYEMVTGRPPYQADTPMAVMIKHINDPLPRPQKYIADIPDEVEQAIFKALSKDPDHRFQTMSEFAEALEELSRVRPIESLPQKTQIAAVSNIEQTYKVSIPDKKENVQSIQTVVSKSGVLKKPRSAKMIKKYLWVPIVLGIVGIGSIGFFAIPPLFRSRSAEPTTIPTMIAVLPSLTQKIEVVIPKATATMTLEPTLEPSKTPTIQPSPTVVAYDAGSVFVSIKDDAEMVFVPEGDFWMGATEADPYASLDEFPQHRVFLDSYWIDRYEVTASKYSTFLNAAGNQSEGGSVWMQVGAIYSVIEQSNGVWQPIAGFDNYPVTGLSWFGAKAYCDWVGRRLPTEAEWEKAARGLDNRMYPWGDTFDSANGNFEGGSDGYSRSAPVGTFLSGVSPFGAFDMAGNVSEWVMDWFGDDYYANSPHENPLGPATGENRVLKSGPWTGTLRSVRISERGRSGPGTPGGESGVRCAVSAGPSGEPLVSSSN